MAYPYQKIDEVIDAVFSAEHYGPHIRARARILVEEVREYFIYHPERLDLSNYVIPKPYHFFGHTFGMPRPERKGMNHTAEGYRVCERCGRSDVYLLSEEKNGLMPPCQ